MAGRRIPLAWHNLIEDRWRLLASVAGTAFAVVLMLSQIGFRNALLDNMVAVITRLDGTLVMINRNRYIFSEPIRFPKRRLEFARGFPGVLSVHPFYNDVYDAVWRNPLNGLSRPIRVLACRPKDRLIDLPDVNEQLAQLDRPDVALADDRSKADFFGPLREGVISELRGRRIEIIGTFSLGTDFRSNGTLLMSETNIRSYFPERQGPTEGDTLIDAGVIRLRPGADAAAIKANLRAVLPADVTVMSRDELADKERTFWEAVAPIGVVFDIGVVMGFIVGIAICYQVLYSEISDRVAEFATLKAMGYTSGELLRIIVIEGVYLAFMGYAVGLGIGLALTQYLQKRTGLEMTFGLDDLIMVLGLTVGMCVLSGALAGHKLRSVDPAELFG